MSEKKSRIDQIPTRSQFALDALQMFSREIGADFDDVLNDPDQDAVHSCMSDLLTGLMHVCRARGLAFSSVLDSAGTYFAEEVAEEIASQKSSFRYANGSTSGSFNAKVLGTSAEHVVLAIGGEALIVSNARLDRIPAEGELTRISFSDGVGTFDEPKALPHASTALNMDASMSLYALRAWPPKALVADLYDDDQAFSSALLKVFGDAFEYPDYSHKTVAQVIHSGELHIRFANSVAAAEEIARNNGPFRHLSNEKDERLEGKVLGLTDDHAVLSLGRSAAILPLRAMNRVPEMGENVSMKWQVGQAILGPSPNAIALQGLGR